ncbi:MAG: hypothetical protein IT422_15775 [Pirellulaceae bacterium]|nr:hypothetical protein [Pirellulaceae bacterium]
MTHYNDLPEDVFAAIFRPIHNHLAEYPAVDWGDGFGSMFETYGEEFDFVTEQDPAHVWTWVEGDNGQYLVSGMHFVNRIGYFICDVAVPDGLTIEVKLDDGSEAL